MKKILIIVAIVFFVSTLQANELGKKIAMQGNGKGALACTTCHMTNGAGQGPAGFPRLAGLNAEYLEKQLHDLKSKVRDNGVMWPIANALTDEEMKAVAEYYSTMEVPEITPPTVDEATLALGKNIAEWGNWRKTIPACTQCHGVDGSGIGAAFPALAGQHAQYIEAQVKAWQNDTRKNDPVQLMEVVAKRISDEELKAVAAYFASLPPVYKK